MSNIIFLLSFGLLAAPVPLLSGAALNGTDEAEVDQQSLLNTTIEGENNDEVKEAETPEASGDSPTEDEPTEAEVVETAATVEAEAEADTEATTAAEADAQVSRTQALVDWGSRVLASKYMGSLAAAYLALCLFLAIKHGPIFVR